MVDTLKKLREPAALVLLAALALRLLMGVVSVFVLASNDRLDSFTAAARSVASWVTDPFALVVLAGLVAACVLVDRTPRARQLTLFALVLAAAGIGLTFLFGLIGLAAEGGINRLPNFLVFLADLAIPVLVAVVLLKLLQGQPAPVRQQALQAGPYGQGQYGQGQYGQAGQGQGSQPPYRQGQPQQNPNQPTWQPDQAAGASWNTAGDAASGAAASGWGTPGESGGWNPTGPAQGGQYGAGQQGPGAYGVEETQQIPRRGDQPTQGGWGAPPTPWGAAPYDRSQPNQPSPPGQSSQPTQPSQPSQQGQPSSAASAPADDPAGVEGRPEFGRSGETGSDPAAGPSQPRQDNDWWNTPRP